VFGCWGAKSKARPPRCTGGFLFAYYGEADPYWLVLRSCSATCEFKGDAVEMLRRGDHDWEATSAGYVDRGDDIKRLKMLIEKAAMFRLQL